MTPGWVFGTITAYFALLIIISLITSRKADSFAFFSGNRKSPWYLVAYGMIGASISGVTFISVPGDVGKIDFSYFQLVLGYLLGYLFIYTVLLPVYYKLNLVSIYSYLEKRFGKVSYITGSALFLVSQTMGASLRLFLAATVLQLSFFDAFGIPFFITVMVTILLIWAYTFRGGIKTIVWTDSLQTTFMLLALLATIYFIAQSMDYSFSDLISSVYNNPHSKIFEWDWRSGNNFFKQFLAGVFIPIVMTGLDQNMMQKNLTCKTLKESQKNMFWFSIILVPVNLLFLSLGVLLYIFAASHNLAIPSSTDDLYPMIAMHHMEWYVGLMFLLGITAAAFSSADSSLTALTTSFCYDFLNFEKRAEQSRKKLRRWVHVGFSVIMLLVIVIFRELNDRSVISAVFTVAGYTYGPLLGLFTYGLFTKWKSHEASVPVIAVLSPVLCYILNLHSEQWFNGYKFSFELLIVNGMITFALMFLMQKLTVNKSR